MSPSFPSFRFWKLWINSVPFASTWTRGLKGRGIPFLRHLIMMGSSPWTRQSSVSWRSLTAMTSLGSRRKDNSEARHPPEEQGQTGELLNHANHGPDPSQEPNLGQLQLQTEASNTPEKL